MGSIGRLFGSSFDIAILSVWLGRARAEGHNRAIVRVRHADRHRLQKGAAVLNHMIRGHQQKQFVPAGREQPGSRKGGRRGRAPGDRLENDGFDWRAGFLELTLDEESLLLAADDDRRCELLTAQPHGGLFKQRLLASELQQLLWKLLA